MTEQSDKRERGEREGVWRRDEISLGQEKRYENPSE
jgi:hypothetical protein